MTNPQTLSIVVVALIGVVGTITASIWGPVEQRIMIATMIGGATASTTTALLAAFKASAAKDVAAELDIKINGRLTDLLAANERAFAAEKVVAHAAGVTEGKADTKTT